MTKNTVCAVFITAFSILLLSLVCEVSAHEQEVVYQYQEEQEEGRAELVQPQTVSAQDAVVEAEIDREIKTVEIYDPLEHFNRALFHSNKMIHQRIIFPLNDAYRMVVPELLRNMLHNVLSTAGEPVNAVNAALQGEFEDSGNAVGRFLVNVTLGIGGLNDVATEAGIPEKQYGFNGTLRYYGVGNGPYLMMPIFGPSSARHFTGLITDYAMNPFPYFLDDTGKVIVLGVVVIDTADQTRDTMEMVEKMALDEYATVRSLFAQKNH